jgi:glycerophosphoryl diester phosphodiesterase
MTANPVGAGLPTALAQKIASGGWLKTAHRGAPQVAPGNTLRAIQAAAELGVDLVEVDVHRTKDGQLTLWHDEAISANGSTLDITTSTFGELAEHVEADLQEQLVDLSGAMRAASGKAGLLVDLKAPGLAEQIVREARAQSFTPLVVCGDYWDDLREVKRLAPEFGTSLTLGLEWNEKGGPKLEAVDTDAVTVAWPHVDASFVARCHARGLAVLVWTMDDTALMKRMLELGANGLTSNRPDSLVQL